MKTTNKKSFMIHIDSLDVLEDLTNDQIAELFLAIRDFHTGKEKKLSPIVKVAFSSFKNQFIRDTEKYQETCKARAIAGSLGGKQKVANASKCKQRVANVADSDSDSDSDSDKYIFDEILFESFWNTYNKKKGRKKTIEYWKKKKIDNELALVIIDKAKIYADNNESKYMKDPERWIRDERWVDEVVPKELTDKELLVEFNGGVGEKKFIAKFGQETYNRIFQLYFNQ